MKKIILFTLSLFVISACNTTKLVYDYVINLSHGSWTPILS